MAVATAGTVLRTDLVGARESLMDKIFRNNPEKTPITSQMARKTLDNTLGEYQREDLAAPDGTNAEFDGFEVEIQAGDQPVRLAYIPQIFSKNVRISGRSDRVNKAGRRTERARLSQKRLLELRRDIEKRATMLAPAVADNDGATKPLTAGLGIHFYTNSDVGAGGAIPAHNSGAATTAVTAGTNRALAINLVENAMQSAYDESGETPNQLYMASRHKVQFAGFDGMSQIRESSGNHRQISNSADVYLSNFGKLTIIPHYMMKDDNHMLGLNMQYNKLGTLRGLQRKALPANGDYSAMLMLMDVGFCVEAETPQFTIADLT